MTYLLLNLVFTGIAAMTLWLLRARIKAKSSMQTMASLLATTLFFDNLIVGFGIVAYDSTKILGWRLGYAPIEDFGYAVVAAVLVPAVFRFLGPRTRGEK